MTAVRTRNAAPVAVAPVAPATPVLARTAPTVTDGAVSRTERVLSGHDKSLTPTTNTADQGRIYAAAMREFNSEMNATYAALVPLKDVWSGLSSGLEAGITTACGAVDRAAEPVIFAIFAAVPSVIKVEYAVSAKLDYTSEERAFGLSAIDAVRKVKEARAAGAYGARFTVHYLDSAQGVDRLRRVSVTVGSFKEATKAARLVVKGLEASRLRAVKTAAAKVVRADKRAGELADAQQAGKVTAADEITALKLRIAQLERGASGVKVAAQVHAATVAAGLLASAQATVFAAQGTAAKTVKRQRANA